MLRFMFVCMTLVCLSILSIASQYMLNGIETHRDSVTNIAIVDPIAVPTGPTFEQIYATAPTTDLGTTDLNAIETAAGRNEFASPFTNTPPAALAEPVEMPESFEENIAQ